MVRADTLTTVLVTVIFIASFVIYIKARLSWMFAILVLVIEFIQLANTISIETPPLGLVILTGMTTLIWLAKVIKEADRVLVKTTK